MPQTTQDNTGQDLWARLPQVNQRAAVHWLAVITVKAVTTVEVTGSATTSGTGERPCLR